MNRPARAPKMLEGDIVVTRVAHHYSLGRMNDRQTQTPIEVQIGRADALRRACLLVGADHQVFLHDVAGGGTAIKFDCPDTSKRNVEVYFPYTDEPAQAGQARPVAMSHLRGTETILLVED